MVLDFLKRPFYTGRSALVLLGGTIRVTWRRVRSGPRLSDWSWLFEVMTGFLQRQERIAFAMPAMADKRLYTDALVFPSPALLQVQREPITDETVRGCWYTPGQNCKSARCSTCTGEATPFTAACTRT